MGSGCCPSIAPSSPMRLMSWNCQAIGQSLTAHELKTQIRTRKPRYKLPIWDKMPKQRFQKKNKDK